MGVANLMPLKNLKVDSLDEASERYRLLSLVGAAIESMPGSLKGCKLQAKPYIPPEFRDGKLPPNLFFKNFEFSLEDLKDFVDELKSIYGLAIHPDTKKGIDKQKI